MLGGWILTGHWQAPAGHWQEAPQLQVWSEPRNPRQWMEQEGKSNITSGMLLLLLPGYLANNLVYLTTPP